VSERREFKGLQAPPPESINGPMDYSENTYLHKLCINDAPPELIREAILEMGADPNKLNRQGMPPLAHAIQFCRPETVACLIDCGADVYLPSMNGKFFNAAFTASFINPRCEGVFETVLQKGGAFHVNKSGVCQDGVDYGLPCLHTAVRERKSEVIQPLINAGAFIDLEAGTTKSTPLMLAAEKGWVPCIRALVDAGAAIDFRHDPTGATALYMAVSEKKMDAVEYLLAKGADPNIPTAEGNTCLMNAAGQNLQTTVSLLLRAKADPDAHFEKSSHETALMRAAKFGNTAVARLLLEGGADPLLSDSFNRTASAHAKNGQYYADEYHGRYRRNDSQLADYLEKAENEALTRKFEDAYKRHNKKNKPGAP
jgi:ankyrin repeat protein